MIVPEVWSRSLLKKGTDNSVHKRMSLIARIDPIGDRAVCPLFQHNSSSVGCSPYEELPFESKASMLIRKSSRSPLFRCHAERDVPESAPFSRCRLVPLFGALASPFAARATTRLDNVAKSALSTTEKPNSREDVTHYNNYYEFGTEKEQPGETWRRTSRPRHGPQGGRRSGQA